MLDEDLEKSKRLDADEIIKRWIEKRDKMFVDNQTPQNLALQKHYKKGIESCLKILWLRNPSVLDVQKTKTFLKTILEETREMTRPEPMIQVYQSTQFWGMVENHANNLIKEE
jgi:hypothetical protein